MTIRFYIDPETGLPHIYSHDVEESEVEEVLDSPGEDRPGRDGARVAIGRTVAGRFLRVIYVRDPQPDSIFVVTAYELRGKPLWRTGDGKGKKQDETKSLSRRLE